MSKELRGWALLILLACIWGSSFILMKKGMLTDQDEPIFTDAQVGALRMLIASTVLLPFSLRCYRKIKTFKQILYLAIVGFFGNFFPAFLFTYSESGISSGFAGMLNSFTPIFTVIIGFAVFNVKLTRIQLIGVGIGTLGIYTLISSGQGISMTGNWTHIFAVVVATLCYAISLNTIKHKLQVFTSIEITSLAFLLVLPPAIIASWNFDVLKTLNSNPHAGEGLFYISILAVIGTALAVLLFNQIISFKSALFASSVTYFIPIVAVIIGLNYGEDISAGQISAMGIILMGVFLINLGPRILTRIIQKNH